MHILVVSTIPFTELVYLNSDRSVIIDDAYAYRTDMIAKSVYPSYGLEAEYFLNWINCMSSIECISGTEYFIGTEKSYQLGVGA
jgi:hypothetical protein